MDRAEWQRRYPEAVAVADAVIALLRDTEGISSTLGLTYKKHYIGVRSEQGVACNFVRFRARHGAATVDPKVPKSPDLNRRIAQAGIRPEYVAGHGRDRYRLPMTVHGVPAKAALLQHLARLAYERHPRAVKFAGKFPPRKRGLYDHRSDILGVSGRHG